MSISDSCSCANQPTPYCNVACPFDASSTCGGASVSYSTYQANALCPGKLFSLKNPNISSTFKL